MEVSLQVYLLNDDMSTAPFPAVDSQITLGSFTYDAKRMGGAPSISATIMHPLCLDNYWTPNVFVEFRGERYYLKQVPTSGYSDADNVYKHESVTFVSERSILDSVYFYDIVTEDVTNDKPVSNSSNVVFFGDIHEFAARLNYSLQYAGVDYSVVVDEGIETEGKLMSFVDQFFSNVLQEIYKTYEVPYYFDGKVIHIGFTSNAISTVFEYGVDDALLSVKKSNANAKIVNRCTGTGSADNIPYYYPNPTPKGWIEARAAATNSTLTTESIRIVNGDRFARSLAAGEYITYSEKGYGVEFGSISFSAEGDEIELTPKDNKVTVAAPFEHVEPYVLAARAEVYTHIPFTLTEDGDFELSVHVASYGGGYNFSMPELQSEAILRNTATGDESVEYATNISADKMTHTYTISRRYGASQYELIVRTVFADNLFWNDNGELPWTSFNATYTISAVTPSTQAWHKNNSKQVINLSQIGIEIVGDFADGDSFTLEVLEYINPQTNLMPPIYRMTDGAERFYEALNNTYIKPDSDDFYHFNNPYVEGHPKEHIVSFEDIKPTLVGMTNAAGERIDMFTEFAFDLDDNDEVDDEGNYQHPYFFAKLRKFDGEHGFNLFEHAIEDGEMTISMTSGPCGACQFVIGVSDEEDGSQKNPVQVDANGNLLRDANGNVRCGRENGQAPEIPQPQQNDTRNNEVWIALQKDDQTFGVLMPNATNNYRPNAGDTFVILNINLPDAYITAAEERLQEEIIKYMSENNDEKFKFSIGFSRIYLAEHPEIYAALDENARIKVSYNNKVYDLYVSSYAYKATDSAILPEITVELSDTLTIGQNAIQTVVSQVKGEFAQQFQQLDVLPMVNGKFLRKDVDDIALGKMTFQAGLRSEEPIEAAKGLQSADATKGYKGFLIYPDDSGNWHIDADYLNIRRKLSAREVEIQKIYHIGGAQIKSSAALVCSNVVETDEGYVCYMNATADDGTTISHGFMAGDQAYMQTFNLVKDANGNYANRFYWRKVVAVGSNTIVLSKTDCAVGSGIPMVGDNIVQLGYQGEGAPERQSAVIDAGAGEGAPYYRQYVGINSFVLPEPETQIQPNNNIFSGTVHITPNSTGFEELEAWKTISQQSTDAYAKAEEALSNAGSGGISREDMERYVDGVFGGVQEQIDGVVESHFKEVNPMLTNSPAVDWTTAEAKAAHVGDTYTNIKTGRSWKWQLYNGSYQWVEIEDTATQKALQDAANAQDTADSKRRVFTSQPKPPYEVGDLWAAGDSAPLKRCIKKRATGSFVETDWELADNSQSYADSLFDTIEYGKGNLIRNSGFTGGYLSRNFTSSTSVSESSELFSPSLEYWSYTNATVQTSSVSESKAEVVLSSGSLSQTLKNNVSVGDNYIISFRAKGTSLTVSVAGMTKTVTLTSTWERYVIKFAAVSNNANFRITSATCTLCELQLERGNVPSSWSYSLWDYTLDFAYYQALQYLAGAIKDGSTTIAGGLILSNVLALGNYLNGEMTQMTAGVSGTYKEADDIAFWSGGTLQQAIATVGTFRNNPQYKPTEEEWAQMAKFAVTHGGEVFLRGYINALGGYFRGTVDIANEKILLNSDGSGHFANGNVRWDSAGRVQKSAPDSVIWTSVSAYDSGVVDYHKGSYLILSYDSYAEDLISEYTLATPAFDNFSILIRNGYYDGGTQRAVLLGNFKATKNGVAETATALTVSGGNETANIIAELVYQSDGYWHLQSEDYGIGLNGVMYVGEAKSESFFNGYFTNVDDEGNTLSFRVIDGRLKLLS